jgi:hypothetical protein
MFYLLRIFSPGAAINGRIDVDFSKLIARKRMWRARRIQPILQNKPMSF